MAENTVGIVGIIVKDRQASIELHAVLHKNSDIIVGRQGIPFRDRDLSLISIAVEGPADRIASMVSDISAIQNISAQSVIAGD